jgi:hypothetical protein
MKIENIINVIGRLQTLLTVLAQLPAHVQREVMGTLKANGIDPALLGKQAVRAKHTLQAMPADTFAPMLRICAFHLDARSRSMLLAGSLTARFGGQAQITPWGALLKFDHETEPSTDVPSDLQALKTWAADAGVTWVLMHPDFPKVAGLQLFNLAGERAELADVALASA